MHTEEPRTLGVPTPPGNQAHPWLIYGAYGFTGRLLVAEARKRGHAPILAGRDEGKLREMAGDAGRYRSFPLDDPRALREGLEGVSAVLHAAGPFIQTAPPMMEACLDQGVHYLDITGEVPVFEAAFEWDQEARDRGIVLMPGVGMDVIPTDSLAAMLAELLPDATHLELALHSPGRPSAGTLQTIVEGLPDGLLVRREGKLARVNPGRSEFRRHVEMGPPHPSGPLAGRLGGRRPVAPYTWGDLATAWRTTGIPNITCYMVTPRWQARSLPLLLPILRRLFRQDLVRRGLRAWIRRGPAGPSASRRASGRTRAWGRVEEKETGASAEAVLELPEAYRFTAMAGIRALEEVLQLDTGAAGTRTPAGTFGARWILDLPQVQLIQPPARRQKP